MRRVEMVKATFACRGELIRGARAAGTGRNPPTNSTGFPQSRELLRRTDEYGAPEPMRRLINGVIACILLAITGPLLLAIALAIKLESPGPVLMRETCIGTGGRRFRRGPQQSFATPGRQYPHWSRPDHQRLSRQLIGDLIV